MKGTCASAHPAECLRHFVVFLAVVIVTCAGRELAVPGEVTLELVAGRHD